MEVEATRDLSQAIVHVDMDAFYAAVEVKRDPSLKGKAFGVGKGVLTTASVGDDERGDLTTVRGAQVWLPVWHGWVYCQEAVPRDYPVSCARDMWPADIRTNLHFDLYSAESKKVREVLMEVSSHT